MKEGDIIGIGNADEGVVSLECEVLEVTPEYIKFWVINGAWTGYLRGDVLQAGDELSDGNFRVVNTINGKKILYVGPIRGDDYNEAIEFMNQMIARNWLSRRLYIGRLNVERSTKNFWMRLVKSCKAFSDAWHGRAAYDDTIPF